MDDRTEPEKESFAWLRNADGAVSFPGTSAIPAEVPVLSLTSIDFLKLNLDKAFQLILHFFARISACDSFLPKSSPSIRFEIKQSQGLNLDNSTSVWCVPLGQFHPP